MNFKIDTRYRYHYLKVAEKAPTKNIVARVDVSHLNKLGVTTVWDRLDEKYHPSMYVSCLESRNDEVRCFENEPKL